MFDDRKYSLIRYPSGMRETSYTVPDEVNILEDGAFDGNVYLINITLPEHMSSFGDHQFRGCDNLQNIFVNEENLYFT